MSSRIFAVVLGAGIAGLSFATPTYLALGDSIAFGYLDGQPIQSYGVQGYVDDLALTLNAYTGETHDVLNLAVGGDSSVSFEDTSVVGGRLLNLNYTSTVSQLDKMVSSIAAIKAQGNTVDVVSFALGANDLFQLTNNGTTIPTPTQVGTMFANFQSRYFSVLTYLRTELPTATILLPGYYNLYAPNTPEGNLLEPLLTQFNQGVQSFASQFNGKYVDFYGTVLGHESDYILPGVHPNEVGYDALGRAMSLQAVPEPASVAALGLGLMAFVGHRRKRASTLPK